jgi:hypothetical protein
LTGFSDIEEVTDLMKGARSEALRTLRIERTRARSGEYASFAMR